MLGESLDLRLERDNSVLAKDIKVREFVFSEADHEILCEYKELKTIYVFFGQNKVLRQEGVEAAARVNADFDRQTVRIDGRLVSFEYVREMKRDLARDFQVQMGLLGEWLEFGQVADVYTTVMANKGVKVVDNISGRGSVFNVLDASSVAGYCMRFRNQEEAGEEHKRCRILKVISSITKLLMLSVWFNPGLPLRFPELSILSFGGSQRNFVGSAVLAHLRPMAIHNKSSWGGGGVMVIAQINVSAIMGALTQQETGEAALSVEEEAEDINFDAALHLHQQELKGRLANANAVEIGGAIFKSMVFVDVQKMTMVQRAAFSNMLLKYPSDKPMRECHKVRSLRQGLAALWRHFMASPIAEQNKVVSQEIARGFGHSMAVDAAAYGFDRARSVGPGEMPFALAKKLCRVFQALTSPQGTVSSCVVAGALDVKCDTLSDGVLFAVSDFKLYVLLAQLALFHRKQH
ncbi:hypothetical protein SCEPF1_0075000200 [Saccharomyces cerevisiae]|nr:hypothetical protein SCEPF1_0075000200 [Saccharomyces cerevisiae]